MDSSPRDAGGGAVRIEEYARRSGLKVPLCSSSPVLGRCRLGHLLRRRMTLEGISPAAQKKFYILKNAWSGKGSGVLGARLGRLC